MQLNYFVTAVHSPRFIGLALQRRCCGFYDLQVDAEAAVAANTSGLSGDFVVIEQIAEGIPATVEHSWWFEWDEKKGYVSVPPPCFANRTIPWAFG